MKHNKVFCLLLALVYSSTVFSEPERFDIENTLSNESDNPEESTISVLLRYQNIGTKMDHKEASSSAGFTSLGQETDISVHGISLEVNKEFFSEKYLSISLGARYGINRGADKAINDVTNMSYEDKVSGKSYGAGLSLNLNAKGYGLKIQPFLSSYYIANKNEYNLSFKNADSSDHPFNIDYSSDSKVLQHSIGLRLIDGKNDLMSYFALDYLNELNRSTNVSGNQAGRSLVLSNTSSVKQSDFAFSIGLGFLF